ncbi:hypothetical protein IW492_14165 [Enterococcus sp. BWB1-3]|uniref:hypothetical protein n=1 Tax=Enterococcus sp. BWB1-3 TaxID=2787713 RepID=UPI001921CD75|nr:hypothetical protein [Enterococcus sp. BWB1-3]MBL1230377.1 hypothetical protein [Enterococcus sp. BWB1-3]
MGTQHRFYLVDKEVEWRDIPSNSQFVKLSEKLILQLSDYLLWIRFTRANGTIGDGLDPYGVSSIDGDDLDGFVSLITDLYNLFKLSPETFELTGDFLANEEIYEKNEFKKKDVLNQLIELKKIIEIAVHADKKIIHCGI